MYLKCLNCIYLDSYSLKQIASLCLIKDYAIKGGKTKCWSNSIKSSTAPLLWGYGIWRKILSRQSRTYNLFRNHSNSAKKYLKLNHDSQENEGLYPIWIHYLRYVTVPLLPELKKGKYILLYCNPMVRVFVTKNLFNTNEDTLHDFITLVSWKS